MSATTPEATESAKYRLLNQVLEHIDKERAEQPDFPLFRSFIRIFWMQLNLDDWQWREISDIVGCCYSLWLAVRNSSQTTYVKTFNPTLEEDGWLCNGSIIIVRQKDMPFLVDSLRLELNRRAMALHAIKSTLIKVARNGDGEVVALHPIPIAQEAAGEGQQEAVIFLEVALMASEEERLEIQSAIKDVLAEVATVVGDYPAMLDFIRSARDDLRFAPDQQQADECRAFLDWLVDSHFTFLGLRLLEREGSDESPLLREDSTNRLGIFRRHEFQDRSPGASAFYGGEDLISFSKSATRSTVHRRVYPDYVVVKRFSPEGKVVGEMRILGLFTYAVYSLSPRSIPLLRQKVEYIMARSGLAPVSHDGKNLVRVIESFPRDELFQSDRETLFQTIMGVARISERRVVRLFARNDPFGKFVNCVVYVPRDIYNTRVRQKIERLIGDAIHSQEFDSTTHFSESILARAYMVFRLPDGAAVEYDPQYLEASIVDITRGWDDRFESALVEAFGEARGLQCHRQYTGAFGVSYQEDYDARAAVKDIQMIESLQAERDVAMLFYHPVGTPDDRMRFKVMQLAQPLELSDVIPVLEHLGLRVLGEHPYKIQRSDGAVVWMHDFSLALRLAVKLDVQAVSKLFEQAFAAIWHRQTENDAFNRLVLGARLSWREVGMLRAYAGYMKQTAFTFSQDYIAETLVNQSDITRNLVALFKAYFDPRINAEQNKPEARVERLKEKILQSLDALENLNEDKILRRYFEFINATLRTNFYQKTASGEDKDYVSFKFSPRDISNIPEPRPLYEIYVYSPRVEGVHLRGAKVARGGLRWSDRLQDYRTEILGLLKAQQVKNAVIVPNGAKGGFVGKQLYMFSSRDDIQAEAIECYRIFIRGLLDLTDNYRQGELVRPAGVICRDEPDPYLVVAADKGTASFSDIANAISLEYQHWLGDAFASGGSQGYDHKKMAITARGAWISVQRHFREIGVNIQEQPFTCVGIGDMSGDVFGNGMLLSRCTRLVAAFNHQHIFIDPEPNAEASFEERQRLFNLPRSTWADYDHSLISPGGGVFSRSQKFVVITPQMQQALAIEEKRLAPTELISAILRAPVDLLWNGGIGTYVKASAENNADVGDKTNDTVRVNGAELRCKVVGEGGNLGMTQLGRVEYALSGGACNTDFIDNSGGVDCSDHEVNIKILLDEMIADGDLTPKQRNQLLSDMTAAVADLVLQDNYRQTFALSIARQQAGSRMREYGRFIHFLQEQKLLNRKLEFLPSDDQLVERLHKLQPLTRPELAILLSYAKVMLKDALGAENIAAEPYLQKSVEKAFPAHLCHLYGERIYRHRLMREIVATQIANDLINTLGITAAYRLQSATGARLKDIALAFATARDVFRLEDFQRYLAELDNRAPAAAQADMMINMERRVRRATRWFLARRRSAEAERPVEQDVAFFRAGVQQINRIADATLVGAARESWLGRCEHYRNLGVDLEWAQQLAMPDNLFSGLCILESARCVGSDIAATALLFYVLHDRLGVDALATRLSDAEVENHWQAVAREAFLDDLESQLRAITTTLLQAGPSDKSLELLESWLTDDNPWLQRWSAMVREIQSTQQADFALFSVAVRELMELAHLGRLTGRTDGD
ncbi:MAG: NAD-glutamate dehydrogenase [Cellvibrionaceae bacterium]|nr:NAD-glutamate dehydrogenase [Cellvibrionaceae bacterium]